MRHLNKGRKFSRERDQRKALMKSLVVSFFRYGKIKTTEAKAKELRPYVERVITRGKNPSLANRRLLGKTFSAGTIQKIFGTAEPFASRPGGYTRIIKTGMRKTDAARMAILELVK